VIDGYGYICVLALGLGDTMSIPGFLPVIFLFPVLPDIEAYTAPKKNHRIRSNTPLPELVVEQIMECSWNFRRLALASASTAFDIQDHSL
jgi:hypothetical protein